METNHQNTVAAAHHQSEGIPGPSINPKWCPKPGIIILPTQTSCTIVREIPQNYHDICCLFDPPQMDHLMIPVNINQFSPGLGIRWFRLLMDSLQIVFLKSDSKGNQELTIGSKQNLKKESFDHCITVHLSICPLIESLQTTKKKSHGILIVASTVDILTWGNFVGKKTP